MNGPLLLRLCCFFACVWRDLGLFVEGSAQCEAGAGKCGADAAFQEDLMEEEDELLWSERDDEEFLQDERKQEQRRRTQVIAEHPIGTTHEVKEKSDWKQLQAAAEQWDKEHHHVGEAIQKESARKDEILRNKTPWRYYPYRGSNRFGLNQLEIRHHSTVTREWLMNATLPVVIQGGTTNWPAHKNWELQNLLRDHGDAMFQLEPASNVTVAECLRDGRYLFTHVLQRGDCYAPVRRQYSPFLQQSVSQDYVVPEYFKPMKTFQMGMGMGRGLGVPPESHPGAWFAVIKGRKRWILSPPKAKTAGSAIRTRQHLHFFNTRCHVTRMPEGALLYDQVPGDILWIPDFWWHESCALDEFNMGVGGVTYPGADNPRGIGTYHTGKCLPGEYKVDQIPHCQQPGAKCEFLTKQA